MDFAFSFSAARNGKDIPWERAVSEPARATHLSYIGGNIEAVHANLMR
jgi:hypothetical protein